MQNHSDRSERASNVASNSVENQEKKFRPETDSRVALGKQRMVATDSRKPEDSSNLPSKRSRKEKEKRKKSKAHPSSRKGKRTDEENDEAPKRKRISF